jgi:hypothetical protein
VIARNEDDVRALPRLAQKLLHHVVMRLQPERAALQAPEIDDVAHEIDGSRLVMAKESRKASAFEARAPR